MREAATRSLSLSETQQLLDWAAAEGWNPGLSDAEPFLAADPEGMIGRFSAGEMVAGISAIRYGAGHGFVGLYICRPDRRGMGHGRAVWDAALSHLDGCVVGLDGVPAQQENYTAMGFRATYRTWRYSGVLSAVSVPASHAVESRAAEPGDLAAIAAIDRRCFMAERAGFVAAWVAPPRQCRVLLRDEAVAGYAVLRQCRTGFKIGPLFAPDAGAALALLSSFAPVTGNAEVQVDIPEFQPEFTVRLRVAGFAESFVTARMYRGAPPHLEDRSIFAVTTLELG